MKKPVWVVLIEWYILELQDFNNTGYILKFMKF